MIDADGAITTKAGYNLETDSPDPAVRFRGRYSRSVGTDDYGVIRTDVLRRTALKTATGTRIGRSWRSSHCTVAFNTFPKRCTFAATTQARCVDTGPSGRGARTRIRAGRTDSATPSPGCWPIRPRLHDRDSQGAAHCG